jgi:hypothetical protein
MILAHIEVGVMVISVRALKVIHMVRGHITMEVMPIMMRRCFKQCSPQE